MKAYFTYTAIYMFYVTMFSLSVTVALGFSIGLFIIFSQYVDEALISQSILFSLLSIGFLTAIVTNYHMSEIFMLSGQRLKAITSLE